MLNKFALLRVVMMVMTVCAVQMVATKEIGESCNMPRTGANGECKLLRNCKEILKDVGKGIYTRCKFQGVELVVCCPAVAPRPVNDKPVVVIDANSRISMQKCKDYSQFNYHKENISLLNDEYRVITRDVCGHTSVPLIVGGTPAASREFPHSAVVGYKHDPILWKCGGSLISEDYVLTAAHCLKSNDYGNATYVLLGDLDYGSTTDNSKPERVEIMEHIAHPSYKSSKVYHDIGLLRLARRAKLSEYVIPICLPAAEFIGNNVDSGHKAIATGWGATEFSGSSSTALLKVVLDLYATTECSPYYEPNRRMANGIDGTTQLCSGSKAGEIKDTCSGDSGGPLQRYIESGVHCMYTVIGITSIGQACGFTPGVYTRVSAYMDWIEENVWPK